MQRFDLVGVDVTGCLVKLSADVAEFSGHNSYFHVTPSYDGSFVTLTTPKGSYTLRKHTNLGIFQGTCKGCKVHVSLKKIVGEIRFW